MTPHAELRRRRLLALGLGGAAALATARWASAVQASAPFVHGVASGDPLTDRVILWTRVTPSADAAPGSGVGPTVRVRWEVARDSAFQRIVARGAVDTGPQRDHTVQIDATGLEPGRDYWYRFRALGAVSPVGHTRTIGASAASVRLGVVSCQSWEWGRFGAYRALARQDVDAVLHLGDYIYEYGPEGATGLDPQPPSGRAHQPPRECLNLADYRIRHGQYKLDPDLQAAHAAHPVIAIWDDHEVANDTWREGAENHQPEEGDFAARARAARQAYREWLPTRQPDPDVIHRRFAFGDLVELWMLDERKYRDQQPPSALFGYGSIDPIADAPGRTLLGAQQREWLVDGLTGSAAAWKVLGNQVPFFPLVVGAELPSAIDTLVGPIRDQLPLALPPKLYVDDWNGYTAERDALARVFADVPDVVVLTGDVHETFASDLPAHPGDYRLTAESVAVEYILPAVSSGSVPRILDTTAAPAPVGALFNTAYEANLAVGNPWVKYHDGYANGFGIVDFDAQRVQCDFWHLDDATDPDSAARVAASWTTPRGSRHVNAAAAALPPR